MTFATWEYNLAMGLMLLFGGVIGFGVAQVIAIWDKGEEDDSAVVRLNLFQLRDMLQFAGDDEDDTELCVKRWVSARVDNEGTTLPAGLYVWIADYPEEGGYFLAKDEHDAQAYGEYLDELDLKQHYESTK